MNDQEYLEEYIRAAKIIFSSLTQDIVNIKDLNFKFLTLTYKMLEFLGIDSADKVIGKSYEEIADLLPFINSDLMTSFREQNIEVVKTKKNKVYLDVAPVYDGETKIYITYKTPIINPDTLNCVGLRVQITKMYWPNIIKSLFKMHGTKGLLMGDHKIKDNPLELYPLSEMQHAILYLCLHNYSYSEIAVFMNEFGHDITSIRVNDYLEQLKLIFHVSTKPQLIEKAIGLNFHTFLPIGLFSRIISIDITNESAKIIRLINSCNTQGINHNPSKQQNYFGIKKHRQNPITRNKTKSKQLVMCE